MTFFFGCGDKSGDSDKPGGGGGGGGTADNPFKVATLADLKRVGTGEKDQED
jgi:hypothetical protein